jgi:hypothetical protein
VKEFKDNFDLAASQLTVSGKYQDALDQIALSNDPEMLRWRDHKRPGMPTSTDRERLARWIQQHQSQRS